MIANGGRDADAVPSETEIEMAEKVPVALGVPVSAPVVELNVAHDGLLAMLNV